MKKRIVSVMLCAAMGVSLFTGACVVEAKADGKDKIVVWMKKDLTDVANNMFKERCEQFAEENDVDVEVEVMKISIQNGQLRLNQEIFRI